MRKDFWTGICGAIIVAIILSSCGGQSKTATRDSLNAKAKIFTSSSCPITDGEQQLKYYPNDNSNDPGYIYSFNFNDLDSSRNQFFSNFKIKDPNAILDTTPEYIKLEAINTIFKIIQNDPRYVKKEGQRNTFASLKMTYGFNEKDKRFIIFYEPVILRNDKGSGKTYQIDTFIDQTYISDGNGNLVNLKDTNIIKDILIANYRGKNGTGGKINISGKNFNDDDSRLDNGDIKYCIMPIQQIWQMYKYNKGIKACNQVDYSDRFAFHFVANHNFKTDGGLIANNWKLHIVVYCTKTIISKSTTTYLDYGDGDDFSGMCPPYSNNQIIIDNSLL